MLFGEPAEWTGGEKKDQFLDITTESYLSTKADTVKHVEVIYRFLTALKPGIVYQGMIEANKRSNCAREKRETAWKPMACSQLAQGRPNITLWWNLHLFASVAPPSYARQQSKSVPRDYKQISFQNKGRNTHAPSITFRAGVGYSLPVYSLL